VGYSDRLDVGGWRVSSESHQGAGTGGFFILNLIAVAAIGLLWVGFGLAAWLEPRLLAQTWDWVDSLPIGSEIVAWVVGLPWMVGLAVWQAPWPDLVRIGLMVGLAAASVWVFYPHRIH
jgi:hypothetical protein